VKRISSKWRGDLQVLGQQHGHDAEADAQGRSVSAAAQACPAKRVQATARVWIPARQCEKDPYAGPAGPACGPQAAAASSPTGVCLSALQQADAHSAVPKRVGLDRP
jgi:hypothetical protein